MRSGCAAKAKGGFDVEDRTELKLAASEMEGRPSEAALQGEASNHRELRRSRAGVVSVMEKAHKECVRYEPGRRTQVNHRWSVETSKENRGIVCSARTTGDRDIGATLSHDLSSSGKADADTITHQTSSAAARFCGDGGVSDAGRGVVGAGRDAGGDRPSGRRAAPNRLSVAQGVAAGRPGRVAGCRPRRAETEAQSRTARRGPKRVGAGCRGQWLHRRRVDVATCGGGDPATDGRELSPRPCLVRAARPAGLVLAAAGAASDRTQ